MKNSRLTIIVGLSTSFFLTSTLMAATVDRLCSYDNNFKDTFAREGANMPVNSPKYLKANGECELNMNGVIRNDKDVVGQVTDVNVYATPEKPMDCIATLAHNKHIWGGIGQVYDDTSFKSYIVSSNLSVDLGVITAKTHYKVDEGGYDDITLICDYAK